MITLAYIIFGTALPSCHFGTALPSCHGTLRLGALSALCTWCSVYICLALKWSSKLSWSCTILSLSLLSSSWADMKWLRIDNTCLLWGLQSACSQIELNTSRWSAASHMYSCRITICMVKSLLDELQQVPFKVDFEYKRPLITSDFRPVSPEVACNERLLYMWCQHYPYDIRIAVYTRRPDTWEIWQKICRCHAYLMLKHLKTLCIYKCIHFTACPASWWTLRICFCKLSVKFLCIKSATISLVIVVQEIDSDWMARTSSLQTVQHW